MSAAVQKAIFDVLTAAAISGVSQIRDTPIRAGTTADYPYIELGSRQVIAADAGGDTGQELYIDIHVWSRAAGRLQLETIMAAIYDALHLQPLTVTGRPVANCWFETSRTLDQQDGLTLHGVSTFRIIHRTN
jgi:hypothetical protein